jgi:hypothetical protein
VWGVGLGVCAWGARVREAYGLGLMLRDISDLEGLGVSRGDLGAYGVCKRPQCLG